MNAEYKKLYKQYEEVKEQFDFVTSNSSEIIWIVDGSFSTTFISPSVETLMGYSPQEFISLPLSEILMPDSYTILTNLIDAIKSNPDNVSQTTEILELELLDKEKNAHVAEVEMHALIKENIFRGIISSIRFSVISKHNSPKITQQALNLLDNIEAMVSIVDMNSYEVLYVNKRAKEVFGSITGKICWQTMQKGQTGPCRFCTNDKLLNDKDESTGVYIWEFRNTINNQWYEIHDQAIRWLDGHWVRFEIAFDITSRKRDEKRILEFLNQQEIIAKISNIFNTSGKFEGKVNRILKSIGKNTEASRVSILEIENKSNIAISKYEWCKKNIPAKGKFELPYFDLPKREEQMMRKGNYKISDIRMELDDKHRHVFEKYNIKSFLLTPIKVENKLAALLFIEECKFYRTWHALEISLMKTIANIISNAYERKNIEEAIRESEKELRKAIQTKDKFLSIIAHDMKNPIYNLMGLSEFMIEKIDSWDSQKTKEFIEYIHLSSKQGFNLLENLLEWSRSQTGTLKWRPDYIDLKNTIHGNLVLLRSNAENKNIQLAATYFSGKDAEKNPEIVYADRNMVSTVIRNLLSNALKFTDSGGRVSISTHNKGDFIEIAVSDTGVGIKEEDREKLFRLDVHHTTLGTNEEKGTGLGLLLCKEFVEKNRGSISVESEIGKGSTFRFILPKKKEENEEKEKE